VDFVQEEEPHAAIVQRGVFLSEAREKAGNPGCGLARRAMQSRINLESWAICVATGVSPPPQTSFPNPLDFDASKNENGQQPK